MEDTFHEINLDVFHPNEDDIDLDDFQPTNRSSSSPQRG
jgi:hypothetical protein